MLGFGVRHCSFICSDRYVDTLTNQICSMTIIESLIIQIFSSSFVTCFIFILLCLAADFWAVKNVTGRFLVGLRWRNQVDPVTGTSTWVYESRSEGNYQGSTDQDILRTKLFQRASNENQFSLMNFESFGVD